MKNVKIVNGKKGYHLKVNGLFINQAFGGDIKAIKNEYGIPYGATEWVSVRAIRNFWNKYMLLVVNATTKPYKSVWGDLELITNDNDNVFIGRRGAAIDFFDDYKEELVKYAKTKGFVTLENKQKGVDVEKLALKNFPICIVPTDKFEDIKEYDQNKDYREIWIEGFKASEALQSQAGTFSLEDMKKRLEWAIIDVSVNGGANYDNREKWINNYLKNHPSLTKQEQSKEPELYCEMEYLDSGWDEKSVIDRLYKIKLVDGKPIIHFNP